MFERCKKFFADIIPEERIDEILNNKVLVEEDEDLLYLLEEPSMNYEPYKPKKLKKKIKRILKQAHNEMNIPYEEDEQEGVFI